MSISVVKTKQGKSRFKVRWLDPYGKQCYRTFDRKGDAVKWESQVKLAKRGHGVTVAPTTVTELWEQYKKLHVRVHCSPQTLKVYEYLWNAHIGPHLGKLPAQRLCDQPVLLDKWRASLKCGDDSMRKTMMLLSSVFKHAVERGRILPFNPLQGVRKPASKRKRMVRPLRPSEVWDVISMMPDDASKILVGLMGFAGLRPGEALALEWGDVREKTLWVDKAFVNLAAEDPDLVVLGPTKNGQTRAVPLNDDIRRLFELYQESHRTGRCTRFLEPFKYKYWSRYQYKKLVAESYPDASRPYDLRHAYASRRIHEGRPLPLVALELGHSQEMCLKTYSHVFTEATA